MIKTSELGIGSRVVHHEFGPGVITNVKSETYKVTFINSGIKEISRFNHTMEVTEAVEAPDDLISNAELVSTLTYLLKKYVDLPEEVSLAGKWTGGKMVLHPGDKNLAVKEIPIDSFFHKIVMLRDRLRVLEQRINSHAALSDEDKINMQQYITKIYGSLTTFNVLFKYPQHQFTGEKTKE